MSTPEEPLRSSDDSATVLDIAIGRLADWMNRGAVPVTLAVILATVFVFRFTTETLGISTDTSDMLSPELSFRQTYTDYRQSFPQYTDSMIVVLTGDTPEIAAAGAATLAAYLLESERLFKSVYVPGAGEFFDNHALLYPDIDELQDIADKLVEVQAFFGRLAADPSLVSLLELTELALERAATSAAFDIEPLLHEIDAAIVAANAARFYQLSWQRLFQGSGSGADIDERRQLIVLQPRLDYSRLQPAEDAMQAVRRAAAELQLDPAHGLRVQITGEVALAYEELQSASRGAAIAGVLSLVLVAIVLGAGLRSWQLVTATVVTLLCGLIMTAGFAAFAIGHLNLISIAFAVLYIGLGVDYAIHLCLRYRELLRQQSPHPVALQRAMREIGGSLIICTATTATGFYAFVPTSFTGVSELGLIAGTGMVISLAVSLTLLPALLSLLPAVQIGAAPIPKRRTIGRLLRVPASHPRRVLWPATGACVLTILSLQALRFDANPISLRDQESESVRTFRELMQSSATSPWRLNILAGNRDEARNLAGKIGRLELVDEAVTIERFVPSAQAEKLLLIDDLRLLLGPLATAGTDRPAAAPAAILEAIQRFAAAIGETDARTPALTQTARSLHANLQQFLIRLAAESRERQQDLLLELEHSLLASLPALLARLSDGLRASEFDIHDLPDAVTERWVTADGRYRIDVLPAEPLLHDRDLQAFVTAVRSVAPVATGAAVFNIESGRVVVSAFVQALLSAFGAITVLLLILLRYKRDVIHVLAPLLLAALVTAAGAVAFGIAFNFANVIALPLLLGIGVDSGVHMVHRYRTALPADGNLLGSSTIRAIIVSALTTICSFGNLAFSPHPGAASMGQLLAIGTAATLLCMLFVLPALLYRHTPLRPHTAAVET